MHTQAFFSFPKISGKLWKPILGAVPVLIESTLGHLL